MDLATRADPSSVPLRVRCIAPCPDRDLRRAVDLRQRTGAAAIPGSDRDLRVAVHHFTCSRQHGPQYPGPDAGPTTVRQACTCSQLSPRTSPCRCSSELPPYPRSSTLPRSRSSLQTASAAIGPGCSVRPRPGTSPPTCGHRDSGWSYVRERLWAPVDLVGRRRTLGPRATSRGAHGEPFRSSSRTWAPCVRRTARPASDTDPVSSRVQRGRHLSQRREGPDHRGDVTILAVGHSVLAGCCLLRRRPARG